MSSKFHSARNKRAADDVCYKKGVQTQKDLVPKMLIIESALFVLSALFSKRSLVTLLLVSPWPWAHKCVVSLGDMPERPSFNTRAQGGGIFVPRGELINSIQVYTWGEKGIALCETILENDPQVANIRLHVDLKWIDQHSRCLEGLMKILATIKAHPWGGFPNSYPHRWIKEMTTDPVCGDVLFMHMTGNGTVAYDKGHLFGFPAHLLKDLDFAMDIISEVRQRYARLETFMHTSRQRTSQLPQDGPARVEEAHNSLDHTTETPEVYTIGSPLKKLQNKTDSASPRARREIGVRKAQYMHGDFVDEKQEVSQSLVGVPIDSQPKAPLAKRSRRKRQLFVALAALGGYLAGDLLNNYGMKTSINTLTRNQQHLASQMEDVTKSFSRLTDVTSRWMKKTAEILKAHEYVHVMQATDRVIAAMENAVNSLTIKLIQEREDRKSTRLNSSHSSVSRMPSSA